MRNARAQAKFPIEWHSYCECISWRDFCAEKGSKSAVYLS